MLLAAPRWVELEGSGESEFDALDDARLDADSRIVEEGEYEAERNPDNNDWTVELSALVEGHEGARGALRSIAERLEALSVEVGRSGPVAADLGLFRGDELAALLAFARPPDQLDYLHPCPDLGAWVLAWLAGECDACTEGCTDSGVRIDGVQVRQTQDGYVCLACARQRITLDPLEAHLAIAWEHEFNATNRSEVRP